MPRRNEVVELRSIADVREAQRLAAEVRAGRAAARLRENEQSLEQRDTARWESEAEWHAMMARPTLAIEMTRLWSRELLKQDLAVRQSQREVEHARTEKDARAADLFAATARADSAQDIADEAAKAARERRDDAVLQDALDRHTHRRRPA